MKGVRARLDYWIKHSAAAQRLYKALGSAFFRALGRLIPTDPHLALFSAHGRGYNDSPRTLYKAMQRDPRCKGLTYVWALEDPSQAPPGCRAVRPDTPAYFKAALAARYWITCVNIERGLSFKKKGTIYLNTWHGTPIKTVGNAAGGRKDYDFSNIDLFCCAGEYERQIYLRDFGVRPQAILESGLPRNDALYAPGEEQARAARRRLGIPAKARVILYAPTWRDSADHGDSYVVKPPVDMEKWKAALGRDTLILVRAHAYTNRLMGIAFDRQVRDVTAYPEVNDLLLAADVLVSDYSAIFMDYAILEKPMVCFGYDYEEYRASRGLYLDLDQALPGGVMRSQEEVLNRLTHMDLEAERAKTRAFKNAYLQWGGRATRICLDALLEGKR